MRTTHLTTAMCQQSPLDVSTNGGVGPQVNKFEQVSSDDHQMSGAEGLDAQIWCLGRRR